MRLEPSHRNLPRNPKFLSHQKFSFTIRANEKFIKDKPNSFSSSRRMKVLFQPRQFLTCKKNIYFLNFEHKNNVSPSDSINF